MSENELNEDLSLEEFYFIGETIGEGTFGKVKNGIHRLTKENVEIIFSFFKINQIKLEINFYKKGGD